MFTNARRQARLVGKDMWDGFEISARGSAFCFSFHNNRLRLSDPADTRLMRHYVRITVEANNRVTLGETNPSNRAIEFTM